MMPKKPKSPVSQGKKLKGSVNGGQKKIANSKLNPHTNKVG